MTTPDQHEIDRIMKMSESELLDYILGCGEDAGEPAFLTDPYYADFGKAITLRHKELRAKTDAPLDPRL